MLRFRRLSIRKLIKLGLLTFCVMASGYQLSSLFILYSTYPVNVVVRVERTNQLQLPGVTLCTSVG